MLPDLSAPWTPAFRDALALTRACKRMDVVIPADSSIRQGRQTSVTPTDAEIRKRCLALIERSGKFPDVRVSVCGGWVSLSGSVRYGHERWKVEQAVGQLDGLHGVAGQIRVTPPSRLISPQ